MRFTLRAALVMAIALPLSTVPLTAQKYHWDFTVFGGYSWLTGHILDDTDFDFIDDDDDIIIDDRFDDRVGLDDGFMAGAQLGYWFNSRFGLRGNFAWTASGLDGRRFLFTGDPFELIDHDVNLYGLTADFMVRLNTPRTRWDGFEWLPYIALGLGANWTSISDSDFRVVDDFTIIDPLDDLDLVDGRDALLIRCRTTTLVVDRCAVLENHTSFTGLGAVGMDLRFSPNFGARLEFGDRIWKSKVNEVLVDPGFPFIFQDFSDIKRTRNQLYATLGLSYLFGLEEPPVRAAVVPRPAPPPPPPPPPPSTESIMVCVVDPTSAEGVRMISATRNLTTGDTTVVKNGTTMSLSSAVGNVPVASSSTWFIRGAPMTIGMQPKGLQFTPVGAERHIEPSQLVYIGTVDGVPVFGDRSTIPQGLTILGPNTDLNRLYDASADARRVLGEVAVLYVPTQPSGCAFQALQKVQEVRKNDQQ